MKRLTHIIFCLLVPILACTPLLAQSWTQRLVKEQEQLLNSGNPNVWLFEQVASSADGMKLVAITGGTTIGHPTPIYVSSDGGETWQASGAPLGYWSSVVSSADGIKLVVSGTVTGDREKDPNIYTSDDGGVTWKGRQLPFKDFPKMACSADGNKVIGVSSWGGGAYASVWLSKDAGATWAAALAPIAEKNFNAVASSADGTKLAIAGLDFTNSISYVYLSTDSGQSWSLTTLPSNLGTGSWVALASSADGMKLVATSASPNRLYTSKDAGDSWTWQTNAPDEAFFALASSEDGSRLVAGGVLTPGGDIYLSEDSGETWQAKYNPPRTFFTNSPTGYASVASSADGRKLVAISDGEGFYTLDLGSALKVEYSILPKTDPEHQFELCDDFQVIAKVTNTTDSTITGVMPQAPPTIGVKGVVRALAPAIPNTAQTLPAHGKTTFKWKFRAEKIGKAYLSGIFKGTQAGTPFTTTATAPFALTIVRPDLVVNMKGDESASDPTDGCADVNPSKPGRQTTLRAAIETANVWAGRDVIYFDLPDTGTAEINLTKPLPPLTEGCEIRGKSQPRTGKVGIFGYSFVDGANGTAAIEMKGNSSLNGLVFGTFSKSKTPLVLMSKGSNEIVGCVFGEDISGKITSGATLSVKVTGGKQQIGGTGAGMGNRFFKGDVGILIFKTARASVYQGTVIEGNQFGEEKGLKTGLGNAIVIHDSASNRIGGTVNGAKNTFLGCKGAAVLLIGTACEKNQILGNIWGLRVDGTRVDAAATNSYALYFTDGAHDNQIGSSNPKGRNIISGCHSAGICFSKGSHDNFVEGNWIGIAADGLSEAPNEIGILMLAGSKNRIGGKSVKQRNVISGNLRYGIQIGRDPGDKFDNQNEDPGKEFCVGTEILGNYIGLDKSGTRSAPNGVDFRSNKGAGIYVAKFARASLIGGKIPSARNTISGNEGLGILVNADPNTGTEVFGNYIGTSSGGSGAQPNKLGGIGIVGESAVTIGGYALGLANRIAYNGDAGIDLSKLGSKSDGIALGGNFIYNSNPKIASIKLANSAKINDPGDVDSGPNGIQNWPYLAKARNQSGNTMIAVDLSLFKKDTKVRVDFFRRAGGGGDLPISTNILFTGTKTSDIYTVSAPLQSVGTEIVALATTLEGTSQFSAPVTVVAGAMTHLQEPASANSLTTVPTGNESETADNAGAELKPMKLTLLQPLRPAVDLSTGQGKNAAVAGALEEPKLTVRIEIPTESNGLILETSTDLTNWEDTGVDTQQAGASVDLSYPASEKQRYFRWHRLP